MGVRRRRNVAEIRTPYNDYFTQEEKTIEKKRKLLFRRLTLFALVAIVTSYFVISSLFAQASTLEEKVAEKKDLEHKLTTLQKDREALEEEIEKLNDDEYLAKLARRDYFLSGEGEIIFNLPKETKKGATE